MERRVGGAVRAGAEHFVRNTFARPQRLPRGTGGQARDALYAGESEASQNTKKKEQLPVTLEARVSSMDEEKNYAVEVEARFA